MLYNQFKGLKAEVGNLFLVSLGKNPVITFQHFAIQVIWKNTRLQHLSFGFESRL